jgi:hypothetical protein
VPAAAGLVVSGAACDSVVCASPSLGKKKAMPNTNALNTRRFISSPPARPLHRKDFSSQFQAVAIF